MTDFDAIKTLLDTGISVLFIWLYLRAIQDLKSVYESRVAEQKNMVDTMTAIILHQDKPTPPPLLGAKRLLQPERESGQD